MNPRTPARSAPRPIKGSWEDLLLEAQQLARNYNDQAIPLYRRVVEGLLAVSQAQREAGKGRLHNLMMAAALDLQGYYNVRDQYDQSLAVIDQVHDAAKKREQEMLDSLRAEILLLSGRSDEALARLRTDAEAADASPGDWGNLVMAYVRAGRAGEAGAVLTQMQQSVLDAETTAKAQASPSDLTDEQRADLAYMAGLRGVVALEQGESDAGIREFERVLNLGGAYAQNLHLLYGRLVHQGRYEDALRFIDRDQTRPVRAGFWRGVALYHKGDLDAARSTWERVTKSEAIKSDQGSIMEYVLSHYYLGDPQGTGLEIALRGIRDQRSVPWALFFLAGLGWAVRGDLKSAQSNLQLALTQRKSVAEGVQLPKQYWFFAKDVARPDLVPQIQGYFETDGTSVTQE